MTAISINALITLGGNRWRKGDHDRIYLNIDILADIISRITGRTINQTERRLLDAGRFHYDIITSQFRWYPTRDSSHYGPMIADYLTAQYPADNQPIRDQSGPLQIWDDENDRVLTHHWEV